MTTPVKRCTKCGNEFPATPEYFDRDKQKSDGLHSWCKPCRKASARRLYETDGERLRAQHAEWRAANPEKVAAQAKRWREEHLEQYRETHRRISRRDKWKAYAREWRKTKRDTVREYERRYRLQNPEKYLEKGRSYRARNPEYFRAAYAKRRTQMQGTEYPHTFQDISAQLTRQNHMCYWCSQPLTAYEVDHVIPVSRGGSNSADNIVLSCSNCNRTKSNKLPYTEWTPPSPLQVDL